MEAKAEARSPIKVLLADDHPVVRAGIKSILSQESDIRIVGEVADGTQVARAVEQWLPDVLALDVNMPGFDVVETTRQLKASHPALAILVLTAYDDDEYVFGLLRAGATGYVLKDEALDNLVDAIRAVAGGELWLTRRIAGRLAQEVTTPSSGRRGDSAVPHASLTHRELEVLKLMAVGASNEEIARKLVITKRTAQNHISTIYDKLHLTSRPEAILYAIRHHLVDV